MIMAKSIIRINKKSFNAAKTAMTMAGTVVVRSAVNTLNRTGTQAKRQVVEDVARQTQIKQKTIRGKIRVKQATQAKMQAVMRPSGSALLVTEFPNWEYEETAIPTRARIVIPLPTERFMAAGFVNPYSKKSWPTPLSTRIKRLFFGGYSKPPVGMALGASIATLANKLFKMPYIDGLAEWMSEEFYRQVSVQMTKATRGKRPQ